jgi:chemotaxis signal transduction protein
MSAATAPLAELRGAFDQTFAAPAHGRLEHLVSLLTIDVGGQPFALRTLDLSGLVADRRVVPVPSLRAELLGVASLRGTLVPVFDLARWLGLPRHEAGPRWLALAGRENPLALAFDRLEGYVEVAPECLHPDETESRHPYLRHWVATGPVVRALIELPALIQIIRARPDSKKEGVIVR